MLQHKKNILLIFISLLVCSSEAEAFLYGFSKQGNVSQYKSEPLRAMAPPRVIVNYRELMRRNILMLVDFVKQRNPDFQVITHDSPELLSKSMIEYNIEGYNEARNNDENDKSKDAWFLSKEKISAVDDERSLAFNYKKNLDGIVLNEQFDYAEEMPEGIKQIYIDSFEDNDDFVNKARKYIENDSLFYGFSDFTKAFNHAKELPIINENIINVDNVSLAKNILIITDDSRYNTKDEFISELKDNNFDIVIIKPLFHNNILYTKDEINSLRFKKNGMRRLLIAEQNISQASGQEYYWKKHWQMGTPEWLVAKAQTDENALIAEYWNDAWKDIISKNMKDILRSKFDGVFFTGLENYKFFEQQTPIE